MDYDNDREPNVDPKQALVDCDQAISDCDISTARDRLSAYKAWRRAGGFEPIEVAGTLLCGDLFAADCQRRIEQQS